VEAAEQAAVMALYSVTICIADTVAAAATSTSSSSRPWVEALRRTVALVRIVSAVSPSGVTLEFFHSGVQQAGVRREDEVVALFQRAATIMTSSSGSPGTLRFPGVSGLEHIAAGRQADAIKYLPETFSNPAALCAAYNRNFPSLTLIITCGDENVRFCSRAAAAIRSFPCGSMTRVQQSQLLQQRLAPLALVRNIHLVISVSGFLICVVRLRQPCEKLAFTTAKFLK
jgi:hypothetical protein